jgi:S1-C subfamily serine protease
MRALWIAGILVAVWQDNKPKQDDDVRAALTRTLQNVRSKVAPFVVAIVVDRTADPEGQGPRGKRAEHADYYSRPKGPCTGTIIGKEGWVVTSAFNVSGEIAKITIRYQPGEKMSELKEYEAKLVGYDKEKDIALLKFEYFKDLPVMERAPFDDVKVGDLSVIVGRTPDPEEPTVNLGILSALHRFGGTHLQTDAELNYGNVGGPVVDVKGRLIGITCQIRAKTHWGQSGGVGFAYRGDKLDALIEKLKKGEKIDKPKPEAARPFLGVVAAGGVENVDGARVGDILPDSPAAKAGVKVGDIVVEFDGKAIKNGEDLDKALKEKKPGDKVKIKVKRAGKKEGEYTDLEFEVKLDEEPDF